MLDLLVPDFTERSSYLYKRVYHWRIVLVLLLAVLKQLPVSSSFHFRGPIRFRFQSAGTPLAMSSPMDAPFGSWESHITSKAITASSVRFGGLYVTCPPPPLNNDDATNAKDILLWLEGRPEEGGRNVLCRYSYNEDSNSSNTAMEAARTRPHVVDISPPTCNIRTRVHEYGGGAVVLGETWQDLFVSDFLTQQLCHLLPPPGNDEAASSLKPISPLSTNLYRFGDGVHHQGIIYTVCEDHGPDGSFTPQQVENKIVALNVSTGEMTVLASGNDFYSSPRFHHGNLAYITWNHPNMPWDATELRVLELSPDTMTVLSDVGIAGGIDGDDSIMQPLWHPVTGDLFYLSDESGYYNLYRLPASSVSSSSMQPQHVWKLSHDLGGSAPGWMLGQQGYTFLPQDGRLAAVYQKNGKSVLVLAKVGNEQLEDIQEFGTDQHGLPMMFGSLTPAKQSPELYFIGGSPSTPSSIYKWNWSTPTEPAQLLICSSSQSYEEGIISVPRQVEFPTTNSLTAFGYYYPPKNHRYTSTTDPKGPPLLVKAHGGPTACTGTSFNPNIQFWTSRGFAILDVDYGGSTGYGKDYRRRLRSAWGIVDIDDVCNGAQYLVQQGLADGSRLCIDGGSAGGYTTLGALAFRNVFRAGCSLYGVADLTALARDTHKFESRYLDGLVGKYPEEEAIYKERSPIEKVDQLSCPILLLQGEEDKIVPPNQAEMMHAALVQKGIPTCLKLYQGEQHGFRKAENIQDALDSELAFYGKIFGIQIPGAVDLKIDNLDDK